MFTHKKRHRTFCFKNSPTATRAALVRAHALRSAPNRKLSVYFTKKKKFRLSPDY